MDKAMKRYLEILAHAEESGIMPVIEATDVSQDDFHTAINKADAAALVVIGEKRRPILTEKGRAALQQ